VVTVQLVVSKTGDAPILRLGIPDDFHYSIVELVVCRLHPGIGRQATTCDISYQWKHTYPILSRLRATRQKIHIELPLICL
jgi:hypothetical protein